MLLKASLRVGFGAKSSTSGGRRRDAGSPSWRRIESNWRRIEARLCTREVKRVDDKSASADATKRNAP